MDKKQGRPTTYTPELANYVCHMIATHACGMGKLTEMYEEFPHKSTIYSWFYKHESFNNQYLEARRLQANVLADSMLDLPQNISRFEDKDGVQRIDSGILGQAKLSMEVLKWHASKMAPKIYGDKYVEDLRADNERVKRELEELRSQLDAKNIKDY